MTDPNYRELLDLIATLKDQVIDLSEELAAAVEQIGHLTEQVNQGETS